MKKIIFSIIVSCFILLSYKQSLLANSDILLPIVVEKGIGSDEMLLEDGVEVRYNPVDWNQLGTYTITYFHLYKEILIERLVIIVDHTQLLDGLVREEITQWTALEITSIDGACYLNENQYILYGSKRVVGDSLQMVLPQAQAWIQYYQDDTLVWNKTWEDFSAIFAIKPTINGIIIALTIEEELLSPDVLIIEMAKNGNILREKKIQGNKIEVGFDLILQGNDMYLFYISDSTQGDANFTITPCQYTVVMKIRYDNFSIQIVKTFGNNQLNRWVGVEFYQNRLILLQEFRGTAGDYQHKNGSYHVQFIMLLDSNLYTLWQESTPYFFETFYLEADQVCLVRCKGVSHNESRIEFHCYDLRVLLPKTYYYSIYDSSIEIDKVRAIKNKQGKVMLCLFADFQSADQNHIYGFLFMNNHQDYLFYSYDEITNKNDLYSFSFEDQLIIWKIKDEKIIKQKMILIQMKVVSIQVIQGQSQTKYRIYINGEGLDLINNQNVELEQFGWHENKLLCTSDYVEMQVKNKFYVPKLINIVDQAIYDKKIVLSFNGEGYLNNQAITSPYLLEDIGDFCLIVYGSLDEREIINFSIADLCIKPIDYEWFDSIGCLSEIDAKTPQYETDYQVTYLDLEEKTSFQPFLFFGIAGTVTSGVWFILEKKRVIK